MPLTSHDNDNLQPNLAVSRHPRGIHSGARLVSNHSEVAVLLRLIKRFKLSALSQTGDDTDAVGLVRPSEGDLEFGKVGNRHYFYSPTGKRCQTAELPIKPLLNPEKNTHRLPNCQVDRLVIEASLPRDDNGIRDHCCEAGAGEGRWTNDR